MSERPLVLLLREPAAPDPFEEAFRAQGFQVLSIPVLEFSFVNKDALRYVLAEPDVYGALLITSPRAVEALAQVFPYIEQPDLWRSKKTYVVGPGTAAGMRALGFHPEGEDTGSAEVLAPVIEHQDKPILFLCGNRSRDVLPKRLQAAGIPYVSLCVYETHLRTDLDFTQVESPDWLVFFSPSGVEAVQHASGIDWERTRKAAIGLTTAQALEEAGWPPEAVAEQPTPESLAQAIRESSPGPDENLRSR